MRPALAFVLGIALALAGGFGVWRWRSGDCLGRCGDGTRCDGGRCVVASTDDGPRPAPAAEKKRRRRGRGPVAAASEGDPIVAQPERSLQPGDEVVQSQGDALGRPEKVDLTRPGDDGHELSQDEIERVFASVRDDISRCIGRAVGDYPLESGTIEVAFRVEKSGRVERVRLSAPSLLLHQGLPKCVRPLVLGLHFPESGGANVVTFPFKLQ